MRAHVGPLAPQFGRRYPINRSWVTGHAMVDARTIHVVNLMEADEYPEGKALALQRGHRATMASPLIRDGVTIGAICHNLHVRRRVRCYGPPTISGSWQHDVSACEVRASMIFPAKSFAKLRSNKNQTNTSAADRSQVCCSRYAGSLVAARGVMFAQIDRSQNAGDAAAVVVLQRGRRNAASRRVSVGRGNARCCG
jgi:hypothetical protein